MTYLLLILYLFIAISLFFNGLGVIGLLRFPDVYTRLHAATKTTTFGSIFMAFSVMGYGVVLWWWSGFSNPRGLMFFVHTGIALFALLLTNPTGAHALARGAHRGGIKPVVAVVDRLEEAKSELAAGEKTLSTGKIEEKEVEG